MLFIFIKIKRGKITWWENKNSWYFEPFMTILLFHLWLCKVDVHFVKVDLERDADQPGSNWMIFYTWICIFLRTFLTFCGFQNLQTFSKFWSHSSDAADSVCWVCVCVCLLPPLCVAAESSVDYHFLLWQSSELQRWSDLDVSGWVCVCWCCHGCTDVCELMRISSLYFSNH